MKKVIAVDIDGVLADSTENLRVQVNTRLGMEIDKHHYKVPGPYWSYYEHVWEKHGVVGQINHAELESHMETDQSHIVPIEGAQKALTELAKHYEIILVTSRNPAWATATEKWMHTHFKGVFKDLHILGSKKYQGESARSKGEVCKEIGAHWLIDDDPEHCLSAVAYGTDAILFGDYGWHFDAPEHLVKCKDWQAVLRYFGEQRKN